MRHKYLTNALVLQRISLAEASSLVTLVTSDFGIIRARAQGLRKPGAKMSAGLQTLSEVEVSLLRGKDGWRLVGAILEQNWARILVPSARSRVGRVAELLVRLVHGESDSSLFILFTSFIAALPNRTEEEGEAAELLAVLRALHVLGLDAGEIPGETEDFSDATLATVALARKDFLARVNRGIEASGL